MWHSILTIAQKEIKDNLRDRRSIFNALLSVLLNPILYIVIFSLMGRAFSEQAERTLELHVVGAELAPNLIDFLKQEGVIVLPPPEDPEAALLAGEIEVVLVIDEAYAEAFQSGEPARIQVLRDESNNGATVLVRRTETLLEQYGSRTASLRLLARGVSPSIIRPVLIDEVDVSTQANEAASTVLNLLPVIMFTAAFLGGFYMVIDMTAGERERESLEPLLMNPVPRWTFVIGKYVTALLFTAFGTVLATAVFLILLSLPALQSLTQIRVSVEMNAVVTAVLIVAPVVFMAVSLQMVIASYARNVKEAQTYTQLLSLAGFMPALFLSILPIKQQAWMTFVPTISQVFLVNKVMRGEVLDASQLLISVGITLLIGVVSLAVAMRLYNQEQIVLIG